MIIQLRRGLDVKEENEEKFIEILQNDGIFEIKFTITTIFVEVSIDQLHTIHKVLDGFRMGWL